MADKNLIRIEKATPGTSWDNAPKAYTEDEKKKLRRKEAIRQVLSGDVFSKRKMLDASSSFNRKMMKGERDENGYYDENGNYVQVTDREVKGTPIEAKPAPSSSVKDIPASKNTVSLEVEEKKYKPIK